MKASQKTAVYRTVGPVKNPGQPTGREREHFLTNKRNLKIKCQANFQSDKMIEVWESLGKPSKVILVGKQLFTNFKLPDISGQMLFQLPQCSREGAFVSSLFTWLNVER